MNANVTETESFFEVYKITQVQFLKYAWSDSASNHSSFPVMYQH